MEIIKLNQNTHTYFEPDLDKFKLDGSDMSKPIFSKFKIKHLKYNFIMPHEIKSSFDEEKDDLINRYSRRIERFNNLGNIYKYLDFIICAKSSDYLVDQLLQILINKFPNSNVRLIHVDPTKIKSSSWHRNEFDWSSLFKDLSDSDTVQEN